MGFTHGAMGGHTLGAAPQSRDSFFTDFLLRLAHLRRLRSPTHRDRSLGRTLERRRRGSGAQIRISPARARPLLWWCSAWVPVPVASFVSATAPQAQAPLEEVHAPGRGSASKFTDEAEMSELLLQGVRASVVQRSSHLSKDVAAFSKIRW